MGFWEDVALSKLINAEDDEDVMKAGFLFGLEEEKTCKKSYPML